MLTRFSLGSNFAPDTPVRQKGIDPLTGTCYLEELADLKGINTKSEDMRACGVRRVFGFFVKAGLVKEVHPEKDAVLAGLTATWGERREQPSGSACALFL